MQDALGRHQKMRFACARALVPGKGPFGKLYKISSRLGRANQLWEKSSALWFLFKWGCCLGRGLICWRIRRLFDLAKIPSDAAGLFERLRVSLTAPGQGTGFVFSVVTEARGSSREV